MVPIGPQQSLLLKTYPSSSGMAGGLGLMGSTIRPPLQQQPQPQQYSSSQSKSHSHSQASSSSNNVRHQQRKAKVPVVLQALEEGESTVSIDDSITQAQKGKD